MKYLESGVTLIESNSIVLYLGLSDEILYILVVQGAAKLSEVKL